MTIEQGVPRPNPVGVDRGGEAVSDFERVRREIASHLDPAIAACRAAQELYLEVPLVPGGEKKVRLAEFFGASNFFWTATKGMDQQQRAEIMDSYLQQAAAYDVPELIAPDEPAPEERLSERTVVQPPRPVPVSPPRVADYRPAPPPEEKAWERVDIASRRAGDY